MGGSSADAASAPSWGGGLGGAACLPRVIHRLHSVATLHNGTTLPPPAQRKAGETQQQRPTNALLLLACAPSHPCSNLLCSLSSASLSPAPLPSPSALLPFRPLGRAPPSQSLPAIRQPAFYAPPRVRLPAICCSLALNVTCTGVCQQSEVSAEGWGGRPGWGGGGAQQGGRGSGWCG